MPKFTATVVRTNTAITGVGVEANSPADAHRKIWAMIEDVDFDGQDQNPEYEVRDVEMV